MKFLDKQTPKIEFDKIHALIIPGMSTNKAEIVKVNGYGDIADNYEAENNFYIVRFTYVPYALQEDVESDGNQLASGDLVCNVIYTSPVRNKSLFMSINI